MLKRILVLDDHQDMLDVVHEALTYEKFQVKVTSDSRNILSIAENFNPDVLIMDYKLTGSKGGEVCKMIKSNKNLRNTPVIICSAYINRNIDVMACGCDAVLAKPFGLDELVDKVNNLIS
jgi:DNA-binding response OmpR family regulator